MFSIRTAFKAGNDILRVFTNLNSVLHHRYAAGSKSLEERVGLPPKPKKPLTPFFRFIKQLRPIIIVQNPHYKATDVIKEISKKWETVDPALKEKFQDEYRKEKVIYVETRAKYDCQITEEQRSEMKQLKKQAIAAKERLMTKKRIAQLERPKKPASAFLMYISKQRELTPPAPNQTYREWHASMTQKWSSLSDIEKQTYFQMFRDRLVNYKENIAIWEEKMIRMGNMDVVRHEILMNPPTLKKIRPGK